MPIPFKLNRLREVIRTYESAVVAFSGGVDSACVLKVARDVLAARRVLAVTGKSDSLAERELETAKQLALEFDVEHRVIETEELRNPDYRANSSERCYFCKTELYTRLDEIRRQAGFSVICNGTNTDDLSDWRPGLRAAEAYEVKSPLVEADLTKEDIRLISRELGISIWDKPASPCLSSRVPYGESVTEEKLAQIERGESFLKDLGFRVIRLRHFGTKARLELGADEFVRVMDVRLRDEIARFILSLGFKTVVFEPYRQGRLNEAVNQPVHGEVLSRDTASSI